MGRIPGGIFFSLCEQLQPMCSSRSRSCFQTFPWSFTWHGQLWHSKSVPLSQRGTPSSTSVVSPTLLRQNLSLSPQCWQGNKGRGSPKAMDKPVTIQERQGNPLPFLPPSSLCIIEVSLICIVPSQAELVKKKIYFYGPFCLCKITPWRDKIYFALGHDNLHQWDLWSTF